jgi:hypothetical protein
LQRIQMISAETMFYFSASIRLGSKSCIVLKQRKRIRRCLESRLKAPSAPSGETLMITVSCADENGAWMLRSLSLDSRANVTEVFCNS